MSGGLDELQERIEQMASGSVDRDNLMARAVAGLLTCVPLIGGARQQEALEKAQEGIGLLSRHVPETDERLIILREMYALAAQEAG